MCNKIVILRLYLYYLVIIYYLAIILQLSVISLFLNINVGLFGYWSGRSRTVLKYILSIMLSEQPLLDLLISMYFLCWFGILRNTLVFFISYWSNIIPLLSSSCNYLLLLYSLTFDSIVSMRWHLILGILWWESSLVHFKEIEYGETYHINIDIKNR